MIRGERVAQVFAVVCLGVLAAIAVAVFVGMVAGGGIGG